MLVVVIVAQYLIDVALALGLWLVIHQHNELVSDYATTREAVTACAKVIRSVARGPADA